MSIYQQNRHAHSVGWSTWHFEWCTKYRYKMFRQEYIKNLCLIAIQEVAKKHGIEIIDIEVDMDHVHVIVAIPMTMTPTRALCLIKGLSSKLLFQLVPNFRKRYNNGHLWSPGKFAASVGHITLEKAKQYLETHHAKTHTRYPTGIPACEGEAEQVAQQGNPLGRGGRQILMLNTINFKS